MIALPVMSGLSQRKLYLFGEHEIKIYADREYGAGVVKHDGQSWLRVRIDMPSDFVGNAVDGWLDSKGRRIRLQWTDNLVSWHSGHVQDAPVADIVTGGIRSVFVESIHPQDSQQLTVDNVIRWERPTGTHIYYWQYAQSITLLRLAGVVVDLPNNPYAIPGDAEQLQYDLREAGFAGAVVELNPLEERWEIRAYDMPSDNYQHGPGGTVYPGHQYINNKGEIADMITLSGTYPNPRFFNGTSLEPFVIYKIQDIRAQMRPF